MSYEQNRQSLPWTPSVTAACGGDSSLWEGAKNSLCHGGLRETRRHAFPWRARRVAMPSPGGIAALRRRWRKQQSRNYRSRAIDEPSRSRPGNGKCGKAEKVPQCSHWGR